MAHRRDQGATIDAYVIARLTEDHRHDLAKREAIIVTLREFIEAHGLTPPTPDGEAALARFRAAFNLDDPNQHPELLAEPWRP